MPFSRSMECINSATSRAVKPHCKSARWRNASDCGLAKYVAMASTVSALSFVSLRRINSDRQPTMGFATHLRSRSSKRHLCKVSAVKTGSSPDVLRSRERLSFLRNGKYVMALLRVGACILHGFPQISSASSVFSWVLKAFKKSVSILSVSPQRASSNPRKCASLDAAASTAKTQFPSA